MDRNRYRHKNSLRKLIRVLWIDVRALLTSGKNIFHIKFKLIIYELSFLLQIQKLNSTWHTLRQKYTDCAFNFEAKLRPTLKHMNECTNPQAPNTTIPHILPVILLQERTLQDFTSK